MVQILSDSTCDLSEELKKRYQIQIIPLHILLGREEYEDGIDIDPDAIYRWSDERKDTPKTSAPAIDRAIQIMKPYLDEGKELVCFAISETMSTSANIMRLAAQELGAQERVFVIDSKNLSTGIGHLVIEAAILAGEGKSGREIVSEMEKLRPRVRASFVVDTLVYLYRGGRCNGLSAMVGSALKLHPMIAVSDGKMSAGKKYRGNLGRAIHAYIKDLTPALQNAKKDRVFITHSGCDSVLVEEVRTYLNALQIFDEILETRAGGVISSHCGPGTLGVLFLAKNS